MEVGLVGMRVFLRLSQVIVASVEGDPAFIHDEIVISSEFVKGMGFLVWFSSFCGLDGDAQISKTHDDAFLDSC